MKIIVKNPSELKSFIIKSGLDQGEFAFRLGITRSYSNLVVNGKNSPSPALAKKISDLLDVDFDHLFFIENVNLQETV